MDILFTGGSSFTGYWFIRELASQGHNVVAVFRRKADEYSDEIRSRRIDTLSSVCERHFGISFGDDRFLELLDDRRFQLLCCHGAEVTNYNRPDFDVYAATAGNTYRLPVVAEKLAQFG